MGRYRIVGCGFVGRNLVEYLIDNDLVSAVRVVDKVPPQTAWLNTKHQDVFNNKKVEFRSANLINPISCQNAFAVEDKEFDIVVNCASETKPGQTDPVYREGILKLSMNCAYEAAKHGVQRFVEISSGHMCSSEKTPFREDGKVDPWTCVAKFKCQVEEDLKSVPGLRFSVIRPAIVYGIGDRQGLAPRLVIGAVYKHLGEMMKLLWSKDLKMNTVHVTDLCRAIWHVATRDSTLGQIYNVVDHGNTTQGVISNLISDIFNINHDYWGTTLSSICKVQLTYTPRLESRGLKAIFTLNASLGQVLSIFRGMLGWCCGSAGAIGFSFELTFFLRWIGFLFSRVDMSNLVEEVNDKHLGPWAEACHESGVENTPLTPYIDQELLYNKHLYLDGSKLEMTHFTYTVPCVTKEKLKEILDDYAAMNLFPRSLLL